MEEKTLSNSTVKKAKDNVSDLVVIGNGDSMRLLNKAFSKKEGWMKSSKVLMIPGVGVVIQFTTQQRNPDGSYVVAEAACEIRGVKIVDDVNGGRKLVDATELEEPPWKVEVDEYNIMVEQNHPTQVYRVPRPETFSSVKVTSDMYQVITETGDGLVLAFHEGDDPQKEGLNGFLVEDLLAIIHDRIQQGNSPMDGLDVDVDVDIAMMHVRRAMESLAVRRMKLVRSGQRKTRTV